MEYYNKDFSTMQEEAVRRVQEMQKRSRSMAEGAVPVQPENSVSLEDNAKSEKPKASRELFKLSGIEIDEEKALIGLLIYILYKQGADLKLILGLGYLLI